MIYNLALERLRTRVDDKLAKYSYAMYWPYSYIQGGIQYETTN
jgi:hypothetical protein